MGGSAGFGTSKQKSSQESKPLTPEEMQAYFDQARGNLNGVIPTSGPVQQQTLTGGDYAKLEDAYRAPILRDRELALKDSNQTASDRGIFTSMNAVRNNNDVLERFAPTLAAAGGKALEMKAAEQTQGNQLALANDQNAWRGADYLKDLWLGGKGQTSSSSSRGSSFNTQGGFQI